MLSGDPPEPLTAEEMIERDTPVPVDPWVVAGRLLIVAVMVGYTLYQAGVFR